MRGVRRGMVVVAAMLTALGLGAGTALAHVTVHSDDPVRGASDAAVMFRVPSEEAHASTVKVQVFFPTATPLLDVLVEPHAGWRYRVQTSKLARPVTTDDGQITEAVSAITWTARSSVAGLQPGQADDFTVTVGQLPNTSSVTFRVLQGYSDGHVVKWIVSQAPGAPEPQFPAPVLQLATSPGGVAPHQMTTAAPAASPTTSKDDTSRTLAILALLVAIVAAWLAGAGLIRRR